jgi:hypothetical protein
MPKTHLITFADLTHESRRVVTHNNINFFDVVKDYRPEDISDEFKAENAHIYFQPRGYGYWIWKPWIILDYLNNYAAEDDIVVYCDAGDYFWKDVLEDFTEDLNKTYITAISAVAPSHDQRCYAKRDCMFLMNCDSEKYWTRQVYASVIAIKNNENSRAFVAEWLEYCKNENILTDLPNICGLPNYPEFIDHRHDQAVFTNLINKYDLPTRPQGNFDPNFHDGSWTIEKRHLNDS